jgi:hypothetical protein
MRWRNGADAGAAAADRYPLAPGIVISIQGNRSARAHFRAEYASPALGADSTAPILEATVGGKLHQGRRGTRRSPELSGAHKLARWRAYIPLEPDEPTIRVSVDVRGPLGLALVQSYVVEPLVSLAAIRAGSVLLPSGAIARGGKALLLIGRPRSGKSSLAARALAAGLRILGDDQVVVDPERGCLPFPRRLRLYPDLARTAPAAFAALPSATRGALTILGGVKTLTRGFVAPPVRVSASELGAGIARIGLPIGEVVVIGRARVDALTVQPLERAELAGEVEQVLLTQRAEIFRVDGLRTSFAPLLAREAAIISRALADAPARRMLVPARWPAEHAVGQLAHELAFER